MKEWADEEHDTDLFCKRRAVELLNAGCHKPVAILVTHSSFQTLAVHEYQFKTIFVKGEV